MVKHRNGELARENHVVLSMSTIFIAFFDFGHKMTTERFKDTMTTWHNNYNKKLLQLQKDFCLKNINKN